ncbi:MAG: helix-turn-helix transcriptional regulator [Thermoleophilia bacterium]
MSTSHRWSGDAQPASFRIYNASSFGAAVREFRKQRGLTQQELADRVGVTRRYIVALENGERTEALQRLVSVLQALDTRVVIEEAEW